MADLTLRKGNIHQVHAGQNGYIEYTGVASFVTTETSADLEIPFAQITDWSLSPLTGATNLPVAGDALSLAEGHANGVVSRDASRKVTIARAAGTTSGLSIAFRFRGH